MKSIIRIIPFLTAVCLDSCIDQAQLPYDQIEVKGADGNVALLVEPIAEQGYRLSACVEHLSGQLQEAGFHIEQSVSNLEHHKTWRIAVSDLSDFSTIISTTDLFAREVWAYAYVVCDSIELQSQPVELHLAADVLPDPVPVVERVVVDEPQPVSDYPIDGKRYRVHIFGQNFVPFARYDDQNPFARTGYLRFEPGEGLFMRPESAEADQLEVSMRLTRYNYPESFIWYQGETSVLVDGILLEAPNWLLPPSRSYRLGERFVPEFATEVGQDKIRLYIESQYLSYGTSFHVSPDDLRGYTFTQYYDGIYVANRRLTIPISYPWQRVEGKDGYTRNDRERVCSGHCVFNASGIGVLNWFDGETLEEYVAEFPFDSWNCHIAASDDPQSVIVINVGNMNDRHDIYRFTIADRSWQKLGSTPHEVGHIRLAYERQGVLYEVLSPGSSWRLVKTDLSTLQTNIESINLGISGGSIRFAGEYNGQIYYSKDHQLYAYNVVSHQYQSLPDLQGHNTWGAYYTAVSGHWLYNGDGPTVRYDLDQPSLQPEFLGCPEGGYYTSWSYPMGDDCYMANLEYNGYREVHRLYRFVEDRK